MLHRFRLKAAHGSNSRAGSRLSPSSISNPKTSSAVVSRAASSTSANNEPSQQSPHWRHNPLVRFGFIDFLFEEQLSHGPVPVQVQSSVAPFTLSFLVPDLSFFASIRVIRGPAPSLRSLCASRQNSRVCTGIVNIRVRG